MADRRDPVTGRQIAEEEVQEDGRRWLEWTMALAESLPSGDVVEICANVYRCLYEKSDGMRGMRPRVPLCDHGPDSFVTDHALLTAAVAYCMARGAEQSGRAEEQIEVTVDLVRLAALCHEFGPEARAVVVARVGEAEGKFLREAWQELDEQGARLVAGAQAGNSLAVFAGSGPQADARGVRLLWYAHLAASQPLFNAIVEPEGEPVLRVMAQRADFAQHPLASVPAGWGRIGLVFGGATKIKEYVFESAKLPEMRGASVLLDWLNQVVVPELWKAAECVIYANGGDLLALAAAGGEAQRLAQEIEQLYASETLTAQSVAVAADYGLLELQYGLRPDRYWVDDYAAEFATDTVERHGLLLSYYDDPKDHPGWTREMLFLRRKGFGELATELALKRMWRREGNGGVWRGEPSVMARELAHFETLPYTHYCSSCGDRTAVVRVPELLDDLCEPCMRKRWVGWRMRKGAGEEDAFREATLWQPRCGDIEEEEFPPWFRKFEKYLDRAAKDEEARHFKEGYLVDCQGEGWHKLRIAGAPLVEGQRITSPFTLDELGQAASPQNYIGVVYADGNNVGALIERIRTPAAYRQFARRLFLATQAAVFEALATHLQPCVVQDEKRRRVLIHPFEIVSIGGDDLFLIVPADRALPVAHRIGVRLEELFSNGDEGYSERARQSERYRPAALVRDGRPEVSLSAGVVMAARSTPVFFLFDLVEELLRSAKKRAKSLKRAGAWGGTVDFLSLKSIAMVTTRVSAFRETALTVYQEKPVERVFEPHPELGIVPMTARDVLHLTACPYSWHEVSGLLATATTLRTVRFPRSQLYQLRELLTRGRFASSLGYLYFSSRMKLEQTALLRQALDVAWCLPEQEPVPWRRRPSAGQGGICEQDREIHWETVLGDVMDLLDFVLLSETNEGGRDA